MARKMNSTEKFLSEVIGFSCAAGFVPMTRAARNEMGLLAGETKQQADAAAFKFGVVAEEWLIASDASVSPRPLTAQEALPYFLSEAA